jgi:H+-transporting ATPase
MTETSHGKYDDMSVDDVLKTFNADQKSGLTASEAAERLTKYGPNQLDEKRESLWKKLFGFFWGPIPWMIEIAIVLSGALSRWPDFIMIAILLLVNAALGFFQEYKAGNAIEALKKKLALQARVLRDGKWQDISAQSLVPGDMTLIKLGNIIPADVKLVSGEYLSVDQSSLTGESLPVNKAAGDVAFSGTIAKLGEMVGVVIETGMETFFGKTAALVKTAKTKSHFQKAVVSIGNFLIFTTLGIAIIIAGVDIYRMEYSHAINETWGQLVVFLLVLVIAGIPVALPAVLSVTMAVGAAQLAKLKAIVSKLTSIEELAGMDTLCSDKTGTLTKNELTVGDLVLYAAQKEEDILLAASLACSTEGTDAIDHAILERFGKVDELKKYQVKKFIPFDPMRKRTEATLQTPDGKTIEVSKGAPQIVLDMAKPDEALHNKVHDKIEELAKSGYRTLGIAQKEGGGEWRFLGLMPLFDPPRDDTTDMLRHVENMGVRVKMVTGDQGAIAKELSKQLGLGTNILSTTHLNADDVLPNQKEKMVEDADGFAEVFPEHKFEIVKILQKAKRIVGMTGDGVNDAPALKQADVGIAVSGATDAARAAASLVLTEPGLMVISHAIEAARKIFGRMKSYAMYRVSETMRLLLFLLLAMLVFDNHPLTAVMIILIALLNDIPIMMIAYDNMVVQKDPVFWDMREIFVIAVGLAVVGVISTFGLYWIGDRYWHFTFAQGRTLAFMAILCGGNLTIYLTRNFGYVFAKPLPDWKFFLATMFSQVVGTLASVYGLWSKEFIGIGWKYVGYAWIYILVWFVICMFTKILLYKLLGTSYFKSTTLVHANSPSPAHKD